MSTQRTGTLKEILSQAEIDSLLSALSSGKAKLEDLKEKEKQAVYKQYDFRRPNKFTKEQLRILQMLHENFSRLLSNFLSGYLRTNIIIRLASADQFTFEDFIRSVPSPTLLTVFSLEPLRGMAVMETNPQFLFPVIDLLFGGTGEMHNKVRELTDIELSVVRKLCDRMLGNLKIAWSEFFEFNPKIEAIETNPRLHQIISPSELVAVLTFTTVIGGTTRGLINLCLPHIVLSPVVSKLSTHYWLRGGSYTDGEVKQLEYWLGLSPINLTVVIGKTQITMQDFLQLQEGDIIPLETRLNDNFELYVGEYLKFKVQAGTLGQHMAVQVTSLAEESEEIV